MPEETVEIKNSKITIYNDQYPNGFLISEKEYLADSVNTSQNITITLDKNQYYVLGDNRPASSDSRSFGPIKKEKVIGKVLVRAWPLSHFSIFN